jgi:hypothetical protein
MKSLIIKAGTQTPNVHFDAETGKLEISGRSLSDNIADFYRPLSEWIDDYVEFAKPLSVLSFNFEYFSTDSVKYILELMKKIEFIGSRGTKVAINWYYATGDVDMIEAGEDFKSILKIPVELICKD